MIIKSIELNNFRIYKGYHKIDLSVTDKENIVIISGKNGFGKTTFLMSLVWCLYGKQMSDVDEIYKREIENNGNYKKYIRNSLNHTASAEGSTTFSVAITFANVTTIPEVTCNELKVTRTYYTEGSQGEDLKILIDGMESELVDEIGDEDFIRDFIMPKEIAKFFFFDAEKIVSLAEIHTEEQQKELSKAYVEVLGIKQYQDLKEDLEGYLNKLKEETASYKDRTELERIGIDIEEKREENEELQKQLQDLQENSSLLRYNISLLEEKLIKKGNIITEEEFNELRNRKEDLVKRVDNLQNELKTYFEIIPFAITGGLLVEVLEQVSNERKFINGSYDKDKVEEVSSKIIDDLINIEKPNNFQISYDVQQFYVENFKLLLKKYLGIEERQKEEIIEIIHNYSESEAADLRQFVNNIKISFKEKLKSIHIDFIRAKNELNEINKKVRLAEEKSEDALARADREQKKKYQDEYDRLQQLIGAKRQKIQDNDNSILQQTKKANSISEKLELSKGNLAIGEEVGKTIQVLKSFIETFKREKAESLEKRIEEGLAMLLHKRELVKKVEIKIIGDVVDINLKSDKDRYLNKDTFSKGEQQMYATVLLKGLVDESNINFPVFIDSPMQKFDVDHSNSIVRYFYPKVSEQVIIFPLLKKEMTEDEYKLLLPNVSKTYLIRNENNVSSFQNVENKEDLFRVFEKEYQNANEF
ncbi:DNA sulfur modification protein DndD [Capnocytophaga gingivalis]|jgi:DNA sulfur modification protein dndD|uniref:DNA sulfur modification protein DndD n=1 Tax=Capnocytophaga gingivalis TaxID=1017 RepID=UPI0028D84CF6|nr:DNA sulfur modification protein DndD [Capnocytophaga gingivalis]